MIWAAPSCTACPCQQPSQTCWKLPRSAQKLLSPAQDLREALGRAPPPWRALQVGKEEPGLSSRYHASPLPMLSQLQLMTTSACHQQCVPRRVLLQTSPASYGAAGDSGLSLLRVAVQMAAPGRLACAGQMGRLA